MVIGVIVMAIAALFWLLGTEEADRVSSGIGAGAGAVAVVLGLVALRGSTANGRPRAPDANLVDTEPRNGYHVTMHNKAGGNAQMNVLGQGVQRNDQRRSDS
ncbi:hypothetical protein [Nocardia sp. BMG51109]|uniref:hypothetical protein n=1 Tax=Nocardia sp. BMG51109 TaxID=1056816 RepID=UPI000465C187|nr:hypothetical protein [Nocardia sp. BMG51109]